MVTIHPLLLKEAKKQLIQFLRTTIHFNTCNLKKQKKIVSIIYKKTYWRQVGAFHLNCLFGLTTLTVLNRQFANSKKYFIEYFLDILF